MESVEEWAVQRRDGSYRTFPTKSAAVKFSRELAPWALQYRKGVYYRLEQTNPWQYVTG